MALSARGTKFWDGSATHNPAFVKHKGKYYLFYMGTSCTSPIKNMKLTRITGGVTGTLRELGNTFGQSVFNNMFTYLCEKNEKDGQPEKFLKYAQESVQDIIDNWDFNNPRHIWLIRNAEHNTPQVLSWVLMVAPDQTPAGSREKLAAWASQIKQKTNNLWKYRMHSETEWAHAKTKELCGSPALGGSTFAVAHLLNYKSLRYLGWAQVDFVFGVNPVGVHLGRKSEDRVKLNGFMGSCRRRLATGTP